MKEEITELNPGYVYVLSNESYQDMYKVGYTTRNLERRVSELSASTGVPTPFIIEYSETFNDCIEAETLIHSILEVYKGRVANNREFFKLPLQTIIDTVDHVKKVLDDNQDTNMTQQKVLPKSKVYIKEAEKILDQERYLGGERKVENKLKEAAKLGDIEGYYLLGKLYMDSSLKKTYDIEKANTMFDRVIKLEKKEDNKKFTVNSYLNIFTCHYSEIYKIKSEKIWIDSSKQKHREMGTKIYRLIFNLETKMTDYLKSFNRSDIEKLKIKDYLNILNTFIKFKKFKDSNRSYKYKIMRKQNILLFNHFVYYTKDYDLEWLKTNDKSVYIHENSFFRMFYSSTQFERKSKVKVLAIDSIKNSKTSIQVQVMNGFVNQQDVLSIIDSYVNDSNNNVYYIDQIISDGQSVEFLNENEIGTLVFNKKIKDDDTTKLTENIFSVRVIGSQSTKLIGVSVNKINALKNLISVLEQVDSSSVKSDTDILKDEAEPEDYRAKSNRPKNNTKKNDNSLYNSYYNRESTNSESKEEESKQRDATTENNSKIDYVSELIKQFDSIEYLPKNWYYWSSASVVILIFSDFLDLLIGIPIIGFFLGIGSFLIIFEGVSQFFNFLAHQAGENNPISLVLKMAVLFIGGFIRIVVYVVLGIIQLILNLIDNFIT